MLRATVDGFVMLQNDVRAMLLGVLTLKKQKQLGTAIDYVQTKLSDSFTFFCPLLFSKRNLGSFCA